MRRGTGPEGGDRRCHGLGIGTLIDRRHLVFGLQRVEIGGELVDALEIDRGHRVPPLQFGWLGEGGAGNRGKHGRGGGKHS